LHKYVKCFAGRSSIHAWSNSRPSVIDAPSSAHAAPK
jgi:hypothetical protein